MQDRTIPQLNTPLNNPVDGKSTEVEITDPTHPLFGRRFPVVSISTPPGRQGHAFVSYQESILLRIPLNATNLTVSCSTLATKLTLHAVEELIATIKDCEGLCHIDRKTSGTRCRPKSRKKSSMRSAPSSRR